MKVFFIYKLIFIICVCLLTNTVYADNLGRLFTTTKERRQLDKIRNKKNESKKIETAEVKKTLVPVEKEVIVRDPILLKGLVYRNGGKSTAWVNDKNTFEGNLDPQFIQLPEEKIKSDQVTIIMPDNSAHKLKVGDVFVPEPIDSEVIDTVKTKDD